MKYTIRHRQAQFLGGKGGGPWADIRVIHAGPPHKRCQWIEGEPCEDDSCKCLNPTIAGKPYCLSHSERAYQEEPK